VQFLTHRSSWSAGIRLNDNTSEGFLYSVEFNDDSDLCTIKNRVGVIKSRIYQSMSYVVSSLCVKAESNEPKSLNMDDVRLI